MYILLLIYIFLILFREACILTNVEHNCKMMYSKHTFSENKIQNLNKSRTKIAFQWK